LSDRLLLGKNALNARKIFAMDIHAKDIGTTIAELTFADVPVNG
jgi:hypothetical protein